MGLLRRKTRELDLGPANLLPAGDPGCWLVRTTASTGDSDTARRPVAVAAREVLHNVTVTDAAPAPRPARAHLAALTANLSV